MGSSFPDRGSNRFPCFGSEESSPLDRHASPFNLHFYLNFYYQSLLLDVKVNLFKYINPSAFQEPQVRERQPKGKLPVSLGKKLGPKSKVPQAQSEAASDTSLPTPAWEVL